MRRKSTHVQLGFVDALNELSAPALPIPQYQEPSQVKPVHELYSTDDLARPMSQSYWTESREYTQEEIDASSTTRQLIDVARVRIGNLEDLVFDLQQSGIANPTQRLHLLRQIAVEAYDNLENAFDSMHTKLLVVGGDFAINVRVAERETYFDREFTAFADAYQLR